MTKKTEPRRFESVTLGLPPLKMVLVHAAAERRNHPVKKITIQHKTQKDLDNLKAVIKLIELLSEDK